MGEEPISWNEFSDLFNYIGDEISANNHCRHKFNLVDKYLKTKLSKTHEDRILIKEFFEDRDCFCDCQVFLNIKQHHFKGEFVHPDQQKLPL